MHSHLSAYVCEHLVAIFQIDPEHGVRERLDDGALENNRIFLGLRQGATS